MDLIELSVKEFTDVLGSDAPAPGGGSVAALSGATGISLTKMVCELTLGKEKYAEHEMLIRRILSTTIHLQDALLKAIDQDTEAFNGVSAVFSMPKDTPEEKEARRDAMQAALKEATASPYRMMTLILEGLEVTKEAVGHSNTNAASDLGVAALNLKAGLEGAWLNVLINLAGIRDQDFVSDYRTKAQTLLIKGSQLADRIYKEIEESL